MPLGDQNCTWPGSTCLGQNGIIQKIKSINHLKDSSCHRFGTAIAMQPRGMFAETLNQGMLEAAMHGYFDFWMRKNIFEKKAIATAAK